VRLVNHHQTALRPTTAYGLDHRRNFGRVVTVVIDQHHAAAFNWQLAINLEASTHTLKARQALNDGLIADALIRSNADGGQGIEHVVVARHVYRHIQWLAIRAQHGEEGLHALLANIDCAHVSVFAKAVSYGRTLDQRQDFAHDRIVQAQHSQAVERQVVQKLDEGFLQLVEVAFVRRHMVGVDIGDHCNHRLQVQEAGIAFVSFGNQVTASAQLCISTCCIQATTDHERRVQATGRKHRGQQAGGGGFAMGACYGDTVAIAHQLSQHLGPWHHWNTTFQRMRYFGVGGINSARHHQYISIGSVFGTVADKDVRAE